MKKRAKILISLASLGLAVSIPSALIFKTTNTSYILKNGLNRNVAAVVGGEEESPESPVNDGNISDGTKNNYHAPSAISNIKTTILDLESLGYYQAEAYDVDATGYATFTSSEAIAQLNPQEQPKQPDQITKFLTNNFYSKNSTNANEQHTTKYAGTVDWNVTSSDLLGLVKTLSGSSGYNASGDLKLELKSMLFSVGGYETFKSLFVLGEVKDNNSLQQKEDGPTGTYLFQIQWEEQTIGNNTIKAGSYRIAAKLSNSQETYNYLGLETPSTNTLQAIYVPNIDKSQTQERINNSINYISVSNSDFGEAPSLTPIQKPKKGSFQIPSNNISEDFEGTKVFKPIYLNRVNSSFFIVYYNQEDNKITMLKTPVLNSNNGTTAESQIKTFLKVGRLDEILLKFYDPSKTNEKIHAQILFDEYSNQSSKNFDFVFSVDGSKKSLHMSLDYTNFTAKYTLNEAQDKLNKHYLKIVKKYDAGSTTNNGYLGLTDDNKVLVLDKDFRASIKVFYDFDKSTLSLGKIHNIFTKVSDGNWYAQMSDGTYAQFYENTLIGQWDKVASTDSYELPVRFRVKSENEISSSVLFKQVLNENQDQFEPTFLQYLNNTDTYKDFIEIDSNSIDPRLNGAMPIIKVSIIPNPAPTNPAPPPASKDGDSNPSANYTDEEKRSKKYKVTLKFEQVLRQITSTGEVKPDSDGGKTVEIARQTYTFNNAESKIEGYTDKNDKNFSIPSYVMNMYPSQIIEILKKSVSSDATSENKNFLNYFLNIQNISGATYAFTGNDLNGSLGITVNVPLMWINDGSGGLKLVENYTNTFNFEGTEDEPFFAANRFGKDSNGNFNDSVTPIDKAFADDSKNKDKIDNLKGMFSTKLPSSLSKQDYVKNFLVLGSAFNETNTGGDAPIIQMPEDDNIIVIPDDVNGTAFVDITFPFIGNKQSYRVSFQTPAVFATNQSASQTVYFSWKNQDNIQLVKPGTGESYAGGNGFSDTEASRVASSINAAAAVVGTQGSQSLLDILSRFSDFSSYYANLITQQKILVSATYNDKLGALNIKLTIKDGVEIPGITSNVITQTYTGFKPNSGGSEGDLKLTSQFSFNNYEVDSTKSASSVTEYDLIGKLLPSQSEWDKLKKENNATLTLIPSNSTGTLQVSVKLSNFVNDNTILPTKTFTTTLTGFKVSNQQNNLISWKSNNDLGIDDYPSKVKSSALSNAGNSLNPDYKLKVLEQVAFISSELKQELTANPSLVTNVTMIDNNTNGTLAITATIKINGQNQVFSTVVNGLKGTEYSYKAEFIQNASTAGALAKLRTQLPSTVTADDPNLQSLVNLTSSKNLVKQIVLSADDFAGTLQVDIKVIDPDNNNKVLTQSTKTFDGFITQKYADAGTDWLAVALSIIIPVVILTIPIVAFGYIQNRKDMKKIGKVLSKRLSEEREKAKRREKLGIVSKKIH